MKSGIDKIVESGTDITVRKAFQTILEAAKYTTYECINI